MAEYTYEDIIINPDSEEAKNAVGKEVFFDNTPYDVVNMANANANGSDLFLPEVLKDVIPGLRQPFRLESDNRYACIIVKKEEQKPKYVPFESIEEFVERYTEVKKDAEFGTFEDNLLRFGMWLKSKDDDDLSQVTVIREYGICIDTMSTFVLWKNLLDDFEFIDGTPCGKLMEESNA